MSHCSKCVLLAHLRLLLEVSFTVKDYKAKRVKFSLSHTPTRTTEFRFRLQETRTFLQRGIR